MGIAGDAEVAAGDRPITGEPSVTPHLGDVSNILLYGTPMGGRDGDACHDLLSVREPGDENVLFFDYLRTVDQRLEAWSDHVGEVPDALRIVRIGGMTRSAAVASPDPSGPDAAGPMVETVSDPSDLTGIGISLSRTLEDWAGSPNQTVVCFHTLTTFLQYVDLESAYRFLHMLTGKLEAADAVGHYHIDPEAHDDQTLNTLRTLFDGVVRPDGDGGWMVRTR